MLRRKILHVAAISGFLSCVCPGQHAVAANIHWNGSINSFWHLTDNWNPTSGFPGFHRVPGDSDKAYLSTFYSPLTNVVLLGGHTAPINGLFVEDGISLYTNGYLLSVDDGGAAFSNLAEAATLYVTPRADDSANLALELDNLSVSDESRVFLLGGHGQVDGSLNIGRQSLLKIQDGAHFSAASLTIGDPVMQGTSTVTVTGPGSRLDLNSPTGHQVGPESIGLLEFTSGAEGSIVGPLTLGADMSGASQGGTLDVASGAMVITDSIDVGADLSPSYGVVTVGGANSAITQQGAATLTIGASNLGAGPGTVTIVNGGRFDSGTGTITIHETGELLLHTRSFGAGTLNAGGDILIQGGTLQKSAESTLTMSAGATLSIQYGGLADLEGDLRIQNSQLVDVFVGGTLQVASAGESDGLTIDDGTLHVREGGAVNLDDGATLTINFGTVTGGGTIYADLTPVNNMGGTVAPGDSTGTLTISGDYTQGSGGTLEIELGGTSENEYDRLNTILTGIVSLDGSLDVSLIGGFEPQVGDTFEIIRTLLPNNISGEFATKNLPGPYDWDVVHESHSVRLQVLAAYTEADFDHDGDVDGDDFLAWQTGFGSGGSHAEGDADGDGDVDGDDFLIWQSQFGTASGSAMNAVVPEPAAGVLWLTLLACSARFVSRLIRARLAGGSR